METIEYHTIDKSTWGDGPWQNEPDKVQYPDPETGMPCLIVRAGDLGHLCGYVGVTQGHPFFKKDGYDFDLDVHGGITFTNMCRPGKDESHGICHIPGPGEPDHVWWLGFDCGHCFDISPGLNARMRGYGVPDMGGDLDSKYRSIAYVKSQTASLAKQLKAVET
jgi:hypothetical protein